MIRATALILACALLAAGASAQTGPAERARAALAALDAAAARLGEVETAQDRVRALTATILAFEEGLSAMREGLRQAAIRERELTERLEGEEADIAALLGALLAMGRTDSPAILLHPAGALGSVRAGMLLAELGPALDRKAEDLRVELQEIRDLRSLQQAAADRMAEGLQELQAARAQLNTAMAEREPLPTRFVADPIREAILVASAETLAGFASGLSQIVAEETAPPLPRDAAAGDLPLPVRGRLLHGAGEADAAGVTRPGVLIATRPLALVTAPVDATIRFAGPLLDFGQVVMLEPWADGIIILAGLAQTYGAAGQVIAADTPVGLMGGTGSEDTDLLSPSGEGAGARLAETLYIEVRQDNRPVDPAKWFRIGQNTDTSR